MAIALIETYGSSQQDADEAEGEGMIKYALNLDAMDDRDLLRVAKWCINGIQRQISDQHGNRGDPMTKESVDKLKTEADLGEQKESTRCCAVYTRKFERGFQVKKRGGEWLTLDAGEANHLAMEIRHCADYCPLYTQVEVTAMKQLAGKTKGDARRIIQAYKEMSAIDHLKIYETNESCEAMLPTGGDDA